MVLFHTALLTESERKPYNIMKIASLTQTALAAITLAMTTSSSHAAGGSYFYTLTNDTREGKNAVLGYTRADDGTLTPLAGNPFLTGGTGIDNDTHGKLGPNDNDTPLALSEDGKRLFAVNTHSNTIAVLDIQDDGSLKPVKGSPFDSHGVAPNSLSVRGGTLLASNRNEDYHQMESLRTANASYVSFAIEADGALRFVSKVDIEGFNKPTQIHISQTNAKLAFGCDFQVDADFDGEGKRSFLAGTEARVQGQIHVLRVGEDSSLTEVGRHQMPETNKDFIYKGSKGVPSLPLGIWSHPSKPLLYAGLVTRNELGVFHFDAEGNLHFVTSVPNSGQDICWALPNKAGTRLYTVNNLPRTDDTKQPDTAATVTTYDIAGDKAEKPVEIHRLQLPHSGGTFVNNRNFSQPDSTAFQCTLDPKGKFLYVICQRINQTDENKGEEGNFIHVLKLDAEGQPSTVVQSRPLGPDGVPFRSRPEGAVALDR